jgi:hypothetical protein
MRTIAVLFTGCSLLAAGAVPAAAAEPQIVSMQTTPAIPVEGQPTAFTASSPGVGVTYSWDLDGDGAFGDASGATVSRTLPAGTTSVSVRATDAAGHVTTETRSITTGRNFPPTIGLSMPTLADLDRSYSISANSYDEDGEVTKFEFDLDGDGTYEVTKPAGSPFSPGAWGAFTNVVFDTAGDHLVRVRATDDQGASTVGTVTVRARESEPWAYLNVNGGDFDHAPLADQPVTVEAYSVRPGAKYEFDLDGDGTYELDKGATSTFQTTLTPGAHVVGVRITDTGGGIIEQQVATYVYESSDAFGDRMFVRRFESSASVGVPIDLTVNVEPYTRVYTVEWDADGDGQFDDGTFTTPGGSGADSSLGHNVYTYSAPGIYEQRARVSRAGLPTRIFSAKIYVSAQPPDRTPSYVSFGDRTKGGSAIFSSQPSTFEASGGSVYGAADMSFDLDEDGAFDDTPAHSDALWSWTFPTAVTAAVKATDPVSGQSVVGTMQMQPSAHVMPSPELKVANGKADYVASAAAGATCCTAAWDSDGDGAYDDGAAASIPVPTTVGAHTFGVRVTDSADHSQFVRKTYTVAADATKQAPPKPKPLKLKPRVTKVKLATLLKRGLTIAPGCPVTCRSTVVITVDKAIAKRLKLRSTQLGKATGTGRKITVKLSAKARKALRHARSVKLKIAVSSTAAGGRAGAVKTSVAVRR